HAEPLELAAAVGFVGRHDAGLVERRDRRRIGERRIGRNEPLEAGAGNPRRRDVEVGRRTQEIVDGAGGDQTGYEQGKPDLDAPAKNSAAVETRYNQPERPVTNQRGPDNFRLIGTIGPKGKRKLSACVHHYGKRWGARWGWSGSHLPVAKRGDDFHQQDRHEDQGAADQTRWRQTVAEEDRTE